MILFEFYPRLEHLRITPKFNTSLKPAIYTPRDLSSVRRNVLNVFINIVSEQLCPIRRIIN